MFAPRIADEIMDVASEKRFGIRFSWTEVYGLGDRCGST